MLRTLLTTPHQPAIRRNHLRGDLSQGMRISPASARSGEKSSGLIATCPRSPRIIWREKMIQPKSALSTWQQSRRLDRRSAAGQVKFSYDGPCGTPLLLSIRLEFRKHFIIEAELTISRRTRTT